MKTRCVLTLALGLTTLLMVGCASKGGSDSNSAIVSVTTMDGSSVDESNTSRFSGSSANRPERVEGKYNPSNNPVPRGPDGRPLGSLSTMDKLRRSRE